MSEDSLNNNFSLMSPLLLDVIPLNNADNSFTASYGHFSSSVIIKRIT